MVSVQSTVVLLALSQFGIAAPTAQPKDVSKRQQDDGYVGACTGSSCDECPWSLSTGSGYPECRVYETYDMADDGYSVENNGQMEIFFDIPPLDSGCQVIVQTPVVATEGQCGGNVLVAQGATCAPIRVDNTFMVQFCCGTGDCGAAGAPPGRRSPNAAGVLEGRSGPSGMMLMHDRNGNVIEPKPISDTLIESNRQETKRSSAIKPAVEKRCEEFTASSEPYTKPGAHQIVSDTVTCPPTQGCNAQMGESVTESFSVEGSVSVGDPLGIVSASVSVGWEESVTREFSSTFEFGAGERGYVVFIPILTCVDGTFCDGEETTACGPTESGGAMTGDLRGVIIRG